MIQKNDSSHLTTGEYVHFQSIDPEDEKPNLIIHFEPDWVTIGIIYDDPKQIVRLRNFINLKNNPSAKEFVNIMNSFDSNYKTKLVKKITNSKGVQYIENRSYITNKLDIFLINRLIIETEGIRQETFKNKTNNSENPILVLIQVSLPKDFERFSEALNKLQPLYDYLTNLRAKVAPSIPKKDKTKELQAAYLTLVKMLNEAQNRKLITPENRRELEKQWRTDVELRKDVVEKLNEILKN